MVFFVPGTGRGAEGPELLTPGELYEMEIEPFPTANVFKKGRRIRIDISSSNLYLPRSSSALRGGRS